MRIYHFSLVFLLFLLVAVIHTDIHIGKLKITENEKQRMEQSLDTAVSDAVEYLKATGRYGESGIQKDELIRRFYNSLYSSLGIFSDPAAKKELELHIPVILLSDSDGYYVYYYDQYIGEDGYRYIERVWSEKMPYYYEDESFVYGFTLKDVVYLYDRYQRLQSEVDVLEIDYKEIQKDIKYQEFRIRYPNSILSDGERFEEIRKQVIQNQLEETLSYYMSKHNVIAQEKGITYTFSFYPEEDWGANIEDVSLVVIFQGYPYGADHNHTLNKVISQGVNLIKKPVYYIEEKSWYKLAHIKGCDRITQESITGEDLYVDLEECIGLGAYACECIEHGARVPTIK